MSSTGRLVATCRLPRTGRTLTQGLEPSMRDTDRVGSANHELRYLRMSRTAIRAAGTRSGSAGSKGHARELTRQFPEDVISGLEYSIATELFQVFASHTGDVPLGQGETETSKLRRTIQHGLTPEPSQAFGQEEAQNKPPRFRE